EAAQDPRPGGRLEAAGEEHVLDGDGDARERSRVAAAGELAVERARAGERDLGVDGEERAEVAVADADAFERGAGDLLAGELAGAERRREVRGAELGRAHDSMTFGTEKLVPLLAGAFARASSTGGDGRGSSA